MNGMNVQIDTSWLSALKEKTGEALQIGEAYQSKINEINELIAMNIGRAQEDLNFNLNS